MRDPLAAVALLKRRRRFTHERSKFRAERPETCVANQHADLRDRQVRGTQQILGTFDAAMRKILRRGLAVLRAETANEVILRHPGPLRDARYIEIVGVAAVHEVTSAAQMREQVRRRMHPPHINVSR